MLRRRAALILYGMASVLFLAAPASASCGEPPSIARGLRDGRTVFVGTVIEIENARRWVEVDVHDIWKGDVGVRAEVRAGPADPPGPVQAMSSIDRTYKLGETYLFVLYDGTDPFDDSACSATTKWGPRLAQFDPNGDGKLELIDGGANLGEEGRGIDGETGARWAVIAFSIVVIALAIGRATRA